jgi:RHS repeat-associated protein
VTAVAFDSAEASAVLGAGQSITVTASSGSGNPPTGYTDVAVDPGDNDATLVQGTTLFVAGWACDPETGAPVSRVEVTMDGVVVGTATLGGERPDVAAVLGSQCLYSGWTWTGNIRSVDIGGHTVTAVAFDPGGAAAVLGAGQSITVTAAPPPGWTDYIFFGGLRVAKQTGATHATTTYLHADHLGSIRRCTNASGDPNGECDYEPFGEYQPTSASSCSELPTNFRFAGMFFDSENTGHGLYHTWFRQYDPAQGRWMSVDPLAGSLAAPGSLNRFGYVLADPGNLTDVLGLQAPWPPRETPNIPVEDSYEFINGQLVVCKVDGITMPCEEFVAFGFFLRLMQERFQTEIETSKVLCDPYNPALGGCTEEFLFIRRFTYRHDGSLTELYGRFKAAIKLPSARPFPPKSPSPKTQEVTATCMIARLIDNSIGSKGKAGATLTVNIAAGVAMRKFGSRAAASLLPGPGWLYVSVATLYDLALLGEAYSYCRNPAPEIGSNR